MPDQVSWTRDRVAAVAARPKREYDLVVAFALHVKRARISRGWTQEELADRAGVSRPYVSRIEAGVQSATLAKAALIANALGMTLDAMLSVERQ